MEHSLSGWIRCILGVAVILGVAAIGTGSETSFIRFSFEDTVRAEEHPIGAIHREKLAFLAVSAAESRPALALGPTKNGKPLEGTAPGNDCGLDSAPDGTGEIREPRLYQLIRQKGRGEDRTFEIEFIDPGVQAFSFTFG